MSADLDRNLQLALDSVIAAERALAVARNALQGTALAGVSAAPSASAVSGAVPTFAAAVTPSSQTELPDGSKVLEGAFDGKYFLGPDSRKYEINHNYISKSKLVEGDAMKLTITPDGRFIYKQLPTKVPRRHATGTLTFADGRYQVLCEGKIYNVITSAVTYYKAQPGDELSIILPGDREATWATVDNLIAPTFGGSMGAGTPASSDFAHPVGQTSLAESQDEADGLGAGELGEAGEIRF